MLNTMYCALQARDAIISVIIKNVHQGQECAQTVTTTYRRIKLHRRRCKEDKVLAFKLNLMCADFLDQLRGCCSVSLMHIYCGKISASCMWQNIFKPNLLVVFCKQKKVILKSFFCDNSWVSDFTGKTHFYPRMFSYISQ